MKTEYPRHLLRICLGLLVIGILPWARPAAVQELRHEVSVVNIAVPVRVFSGERFIDGLGLDDFEVYENGARQKIEAVYLIRKAGLERSEGPSASAPALKPDVISRHFIFFFEMDDYLPQLGQAIDMFFSEVLTPGDTLRVITPEDSWQIRKEAMDKVSRAALSEELKTRLRKALIRSGARLRSLLADLRSGLAARSTIDQIIKLKTMSDSAFENVARFLKTIDGQKHIVIFYQKEAYAIPAGLMDAWKEMALNRQERIDKNKIRVLFSDPETTINFLFLTKKQASINDITFAGSGAAGIAEMGGDFFQAFRDLAIATGGVVESSANPVVALRKALNASENYYLIYYRPEAYRADGTFKKIEVKVRGDRYKVTHRAGYVDK